MGKSKFQKWLSHFETVDRPIGDLAKDVAADKDFPTVSDKAVILNHLKANHACDEALETFESVWAFFLTDS